MNSLISKICFDVCKYEVPEKQFEPLVPLRKERDKAVKAMPSFDVNAAKRDQVEYNAAVQAGKRNTAPTATVENQKEINRQTRRALKLRLREIEAQSIPFVRIILDGICQPMLEYRQVITESEQKLAKDLDLPFEPSTSLQAINQAVACLERLIAGGPTIATLDSILKI